MPKISIKVYEVLKGRYEFYHYRPVVEGIIDFYWVFLVSCWSSILLESISHQRESGKDCKHLTIQDIPSGIVLEQVEERLCFEWWAQEERWVLVCTWYDKISILTSSDLFHYICFFVIRRPTFLRMELTEFTCYWGYVNATVLKGFL